MGKKRRFYRALLPTVVWNPKTDTPLAEFANGQFITDDDEVSKVLIGMGYPEVALDAKYPPEIIPEPVPIDTPDVNLKTLPKTEQQEAVRAKRPAATGLEGDKSKTDSEPSPTKRVIKRRKK
jgi:hypothetical protein